MVRFYFSYSCQHLNLDNFGPLSGLQIAYLSGVESTSSSSFQFSGEDVQVAAIFMVAGS